METGSRQDPEATTPDLNEAAQAARRLPVHVPALERDPGQEAFNTLTGKIYDGFKKVITLTADDRQGDTLHDIQGLAAELDQLQLSAAQRARGLAALDSLQFQASGQVEHGQVVDASIHTGRSVSIANNGSVVQIGTRDGKFNTYAFPKVAGGWEVVRVQPASTDKSGNIAYKATTLEPNAHEQVILGREDHFAHWIAAFGSTEPGADRAEISARHAVLTLHPDRIDIKDDNSTNGTRYTFVDVAPPAS